MSEFRKNPLTGEMTLYAENRKNRPYEFKHEIQTKQKNNTNCPFCGGHEKQTLEAVYQDGPDGAWQIRAFPNLFPAVSEDSRMPQDQEEFYEKEIGYGRHEVLVDTREHAETIDTFSPERVEQIFMVLQERSRLMKENEDISYVQIFKNCGPSAGMSIQHSHWQLMGIPVIPRRIHTMAEQMKKSDCQLCQILSYEKEKKSRIAGETAHFYAVTPYASRFPYEVWIVPKLHRSCFTEMTEAERKDLSALLLQLLQRIILLKEDIGYNICIMDAPKDMDFHWHIEIIPRIYGFAGFEYATDCFINQVLPENAALYYRQKKDSNKNN